ncbi:hypothetical protein FQR65_LT19764 [Abscondita terminalis]|nr:hypothetical protein FQR65_LT19764 [Abscondita terminalis]
MDMPGRAIMPIMMPLYDYNDRFEAHFGTPRQGVFHAAQGFCTYFQVVQCQVIRGHCWEPDAFQRETDVINITAPVTKWNYQVTDATEIPHALAKAFYIASTGRPGPVLIE